jgi:hypothetical protein
MPESSFFTPMEMGPGLDGFPSPTRPKPPTYVADPKLTAGYRNVYGSQLGVSVSPVTQRASLEGQIPIGDHQRQLFLQGGAYAQPGTETGSPSDWGVRLGFSKRIAPQGMSGGEAINRVLQQSVGDPGVMNASTRSQLIDTFTPEQLQILGREANKIRRDDIDSQLGIRPGTEKYGFGLDVSVPSVRRNDDGSLQQTPQTDPVTFARNFAGTLQQGSSFADPKRNRGGGIIDEIPRRFNPATGQMEPVQAGFRILN